MTRPGGGFIALDSHLNRKKIENFKKIIVVIHWAILGICKKKQGFWVISFKKITFMTLFDYIEYCKRSSSKLRTSKPTKQNTDDLYSWDWRNQYLDE